jgi:hypothetical protein
MPKRVFETMTFCASRTVHGEISGLRGRAPRSPSGGKMKKRRLFSFLSKKKTQTTSRVDPTEQYLQQLIAMGYSEETARAYAAQRAAQPTAPTAASHAQPNAIKNGQSQKTRTTSSSSTGNKHKTSASRPPAKSCKKCDDRIQKVISGDELCGFCKQWPEISPTRMRKYNTVIRWIGLNNRKESMVKASIIHRMDIGEYGAERICESPVFRSLMGWDSGQ